MFTECPCGTAPPWTSRPTALTRTGSRHGQSEIGFGITRLLNLDLLPRIKRISKVRLYRPRWPANRTPTRSSPRH
ncbi:Tn3 family transposase [Streptomyces sp. NPDC055082]|uniref:Tn3 family transposase n=1 Tax=Streptomyces sp. NPDC055082 TaxID=3365718 RepID=UPI0037D003A4